MLNILRKRSQSIVIQAMVVLIAVVFIFWGVGSNLNDNRNAAAVVNDEEISFQEFQQSYDRSVETYRQQFGGQVPAGFLEGLGLKSQVLNQLIQAELLRQGAAASGVVISAEETRRMIQEMQVFQENGSFDLDQYKAILSQNRLTPTSFEDGLKSDLVTTRMIEQINAFAEVPPQELQAWVEFADAERKLAYVAFQGADFLDQVEVADEALAAWYEQHGSQYVTPPRVKMQYLSFPFAEDLEQVALTEEDLAHYYQDNLAAFSQPEQRRARHILFKVGKDATTAEKEAVKKRAEQVEEELRQGKDFATLAGQYSEGPTRSKGGDLGFFGRGQMVPSFDQAVFALEPGAISAPVETPFGYHLIMVEEVKPAVIRSLAEVEAEVRQDLRQQRVRGITFQKASAAYEEIIRAGSLDKYVAAGGSHVLETDFFSRNQPPKNLEQAMALLEAVFGLRAGELSSLVETGQGYAIAFVTDRQEPQVPPLADIRAQVVSDYSAEQAADLAREAAEQLLAKAREEGGLPAGSAIKESDYLKRDAVQADIPRELVQALFALSNSQVVAEEVIAANDSFYVFALVDGRQNSPGMSAEQQQGLAKQLLLNQQNRLLSAWIGVLRSDAKIWINEQLLQ